MLLAQRHAVRFSDHSAASATRTQAGPEGKVLSYYVVFCSANPTAPALLLVFGLQLSAARIAGSIHADYLTVARLEPVMTPWVKAMPRPKRRRLRTNPVQVYLSDDERACLDELARERGCSRSDIVRAWIGKAKPYGTQQAPRPDRRQLQL